MSISFIADLHIGHRSIPKYRKQFKTADEHDEWIVRQWNNRLVHKKDITFVLGDAVMDENKLWMLNEMKGLKWLLLGNHDKFKYEVYKKYFDRIIHFHKRYGFWLSHCPIHPRELRGSINVCGHTHSKPVPDDRYFSVCVEQLNGIPISLDKIRELNKDVIERLKIEQQEVRKNERERKNNP